MIVSIKGEIQINNIKAMKKQTFHDKAVEKSNNDIFLQRFELSQQ